ncbi:Fanconi anemia group I protein [Nilaparvata lugens]|uniref:Fanconi anemia group I protein n=1 Tax=Nilaparvata lugens TaxID=108931 RepID=UPI00193CCE47|nr:Fanconi anemia group I protein [Nilaparvata lugens]
MSEDVLKTLLSYGRKSSSKSDSKESLHSFVGNLNLSDMTELVTKRISVPDGVQALKYLIQGLGFDNKLHIKRLKLCEAVLRAAQERELPGRVLLDLVLPIALEAEKFSTPHLVRLCELCVDFIPSSKNSSQTCWKDLLPKLMNVIETRKDVDHGGTEMSGTEFKNRIVQTICVLSWEPPIVTSLTGMFIELRLAVDRLGEVVNKLCKLIDDLPVEEIPPFVHQLLDLCKEHHANNVFLALRRYFDEYIYKLDTDHQLPNSLDAESEDMIAECREKSGINECESNVLYHIEEAAVVGHSCVNQLLRFAKASSNCPELMIDPFLLAVFLSIASISTYETQVISLLKNAFIRKLNEDEKKTESAWLRTMMPKHCDLEKVISRLVGSSACSRDKVLKGMINFSFSLMSSKKSPVLQNPEPLWKLGHIMIVMLVKRQRHVTSTVLQQLTTSICYGQSEYHLTDCLYRICEIGTFVVLENQSVLVNFFDFLNQLPGETAESVVSAIIPVVRISTKLRDNLILVLRKALFSKEIESRKMAVNGFLKLLKYLKIKSLSALSQGSSFSMFNTPSLFSQLCTEVHCSQPVNSNSNEVICLELVGVLKRCLMLQCPVKMVLYDGLDGMIKMNPEVAPNIMEILLKHLCNFYVTDQGLLSPFDFNKTVAIQGAEAVVQEPLGYLLLATQEILVRVQQNKSEDNDEDDEDFCPSFNKLSELLNSASQRLSRCDLNHFELDEETNLLDILPECLQRQQVLIQILATYESMMAFIVNSWTVECTNQQAQILHSLFKGFSLLYDYIKNCKPSKKKDANKKPKEKSDSGKKVPTFKPPETILNLRTLNRFLELLLCEDVEWVNKEAVGEIKNRRSLIRYVFHATWEAIQHISKDKRMGSRALKDCCTLGRILHRRCLARYTELSDFDSPAAVLSVECFSELMSFIVTRHKSKLPAFLAEIGKVPTESGLSAQLKPFVRIYQQLLVDSATDEDTDQSNLNKLLLSVLNGLSTIALQLPVHQSLSLKLTDWLLEFGQKKTLPPGVHTKTFLNLLLNMLLRCKTDASLLDNMALQLCHIFGTYNDEEVEECKLNLSVLNEAVAFTALPMLCNTLITVLDNIKWVLLRLRSEVSVLSLPASSASSPNSRRTSRKQREKELVHEAGICVNVAQTIASLSVSPGACTDAVFQLLTRTYTTLTDITKYFTATCSPQTPAYQEARFGKVVKLAGFHLSTRVGELILYVEDPVNEKENKKKESQIVREARKLTQYIPKLVSELEHFNRCVNILSTKCKDKGLADCLKLATFRDFRLNTKKVEEIMNQNHTVFEENMELEDEEEGNREENTQEKPLTNSSHSSQSSQPKTKKRRTTK